MHASTHAQPGVSSCCVQGLLDTQLAGQPFSSSEFLSDYLRVFQASTDAAIVKMLQIKLLIPVSCIFPKFNLYVACDCTYVFVHMYVCVCVLVFVWCVGIRITHDVYARVHLYT